jgi:hypothetical protein
MRDVETLKSMSLNRRERNPIDSIFDMDTSGLSEVGLASQYTLQIISIMIEVSGHA